MAARELKTRITADNSDLKKGLKDSEKQVDNFGGAIKKAAIALGAAFAAKAILSGIKNMAVELGNVADRLLDLEQITGVNTKTLQEYEYVAKIAGVNTETFANAVQGLTQRLARSESEASPLNRALKELGINARTASGELRNGGEITEEAIKKLASLENITQRNVLGAQIFAGAWKDVAPILGLGADAIENLRKEANLLGAVLDEDALKAANKLREEVVRLNTQWEAMKRNILIGIIPAMATMLQQFNSFFRDIVTPTNMTNLERFGRLLGGTLAGILTGGRAGRGLTDPVWGAAWEAQAKQALTPLQELTKEILAVQDAQNKLKAAVEGGEALTGEMAKEMSRNEARLNELWAQRKRLIDEQIQKEAEAAAAQAAAIEAAAAAEREIERQRRDALGGIGRLQEDLAKAEADYIKANSNKRRQELAVYIADLKEAIKLIQEASDPVTAFQRTRPGSDMGAPQRIQPLQGVVNITPPTPELAEFNKELKETELAQLRAAAAADKHREAMEALKWIAEDAAFSIGEALGAAAGKGGEATAKLVTQALAAAMAQIIRWYATTLPPPLSLAAIGASGAILGLMKSQIPAFADGGMVYGPTMGMVGEYASARTNPEVIAPLDKLQDMIGGTGGKVEFEIRGDKLWGVLQRHNSRLNQNS